MLSIPLDSYTDTYCGFQKVANSEIQTSANGLRFYPAVNHVSGLSGNRISFQPGQLVSSVSRDW